MANNNDFGWLGKAVKFYYILIVCIIIIVLVVFGAIMYGLVGGLLLLSWQQILPDIIDFAIILLLGGDFGQGIWC